MKTVLTTQHEIFFHPELNEVLGFTRRTRKWHSESADPAKALGPSDILDRNPVVDIHYLLF